jgi:hypothetical protein
MKTKRVKIKDLNEAEFTHEELLKFYEKFIREFALLSGGFYKLSKKIGKYDSYLSVCLNRKTVSNLREACLLIEKNFIGAKKYE